MLQQEWGIIQKRLWLLSQLRPDISIYESVDREVIKVMMGAAVETMSTQTNERRKQECDIADTVY